MRYLMDTDHCSHLKRGHPLVVQHLQSLPSDADVVTSVITQAELLVGIHQAPTLQRQEKLRGLYEWLMMSISDILPVTTEVAELFAIIAIDLKRKGKPIPVNDSGLLLLLWRMNVSLSVAMSIFSSLKDFRWRIGLKPKRVKVKIHDCFGA